MSESITPIGGGMRPGQGRRASRLAREGASRASIHEKGLAVYPAAPAPVVKAERQLTLALHLRAAGQVGMSWGEVVSIPRYDDTDSAHALDKRFDRDRKEMSEMGLPVRWNDASTYTGEGYVLDVAEPPDPLVMRIRRASKTRGMIPPLRPVERLVYILFCVEKGWATDVGSLADYLEVDDETIRSDLSLLSMCCAGRAPHQYLDAREEDGVVVITGPRLFT